MCFAIASLLQHLASWRILINLIMYLNSSTEEAQFNFVSQKISQIFEVMEFMNGYVSQTTVVQRDT